MVAFPPLSCKLEKTHGRAATKSHRGDEPKPLWGGEYPRNECIYTYINIHTLMSTFKNPNSFSCTLRLTLTLTHKVRVIMGKRKAANSLLPVRGPTIPKGYETYASPVGRPTLEVSTNIYENIVWAFRVNSECKSHL